MNTLFQELKRSTIYKRNQGRITRQVTFAVVAIAIALGIWRLHQTLINAGEAWHYGLPAGMLVFGLWAAYRLVNVPGFADFLIGVEAEMNKVSWPTRTELFRASLVVLFTIFALAAILASFDLFWRFVFKNVLGIF